MKRTLSLLILALGLLSVFPSTSLAQRRQQCSFDEASNVQHCTFATATGNSTAAAVAVQNGLTLHQVTFYVPSTISAITVTVEAKKTSAAGYTNVGSSTALGATVSFTGTYNQVRVVYSGVTGTGNIDSDYWGGLSLAAASALGTVAIDQSTPGTTNGIVCNSGCAGGTQYTEDAAAAADPTGTALNLVRADAPATTVSTDGDNITARGTNYGALYTTILGTNGGIIGGDAANGIDVDVTRVNGTVTVDSELPAVAALADNTANPSTTSVAAFLMCFDGATWDRCPTSTGGSGTIDANTTRVTIATDDLVNDAAVKIDANMIAHDAADAGNPLKVGGRATTSISGQTMVANNDRTDLYAGVDGILVVRPYANLEDRVSAAPVGITDGSSTSVISAQGAGIRFCATDVTISNSSATNVTVDLRDGTAGSVIWTFPAAANMGGATHAFNMPICTTANTALAADPSAAASTVAISVNGFKTKL